MPKSNIELLIVDDSPIACKLLKFVAESDPSIKVIGCCSNGLEAIEFLKKGTPDVILMDIHMPILDGFETTRRIMASRPIPIIICSADYNKNDTVKSFQALEAGALAILEKPPAPAHKGFEAAVKSFVDIIKTVSDVKLITRKVTPTPYIAPQKKELPIPEATFEAIAIGASLGGPQALQTILSMLKAPLSVPVFIAQHIASDFAEGLAVWLKGATGFDCVVPKEGETISAAKVYIAPGCSSMQITKQGRFRIKNDLSEEEISTSISSLFQSVGEVYGSRAIGVILTGMGRDGVDGLLSMKGKGALTIAQSENDCLMFGMPKEAIQSNAASVMLDLKEIPVYLERVLNKQKSSILN